MHLRGRLKSTVVVAGKRFNRVLFPLRWKETKDIHVERRKRTSCLRAGHQPTKSSDVLKCAAYPVVYTERNSSHQINYKMD